MSRPPRRVCVVTGGRAEYGLLRWVMEDLRAAPDFDLRLVVTGAHLSDRFGRTVDAIRADGFDIDAQAPLDLSDDAPRAVARAMADALDGVSRALETLRPDLMLVLGDRYEILAAVQAAMVHAVPVAHVAGGDVTGGAFDDAIRDAISVLSHVHLTTHADAARRLAALGLPPDRIHVVGSPGLDHLTRAPLADRETLERALGAPLGTRNLLVTYHPVTLAQDRGLAGLQAMLAVLADQPADTVIWITRPNADPGGRAIEDALDAFAAGRSDVHVRASLGQTAYLGLMARADAVIGNSSSGLYEAPSLGAPTVDIGDRQAGRPRAASVFHARPTRADIAAALAAALARGRASADNPYGDGHSAPRILQVLRTLPSRDLLLARTGRAAA